MEIKKIIILFWLVGRGGCLSNGGKKVSNSYVSGDIGTQNNLSLNFVELNTLWLKMLRALPEYLQVAGMELQFLFCAKYCYFLATILM
jgi:hypothetical protein